MSKRTTRMGLGAAIFVAVGAIAAGATASASAMAEPPADKVVSATVLEVNDDGKVIECDLEGDAASAALPTAGSGAVAIGDDRVTGEAIRSGAHDDDLGDGGFVAVDEDPGASSTGDPVDPGIAFIIGTTGADGRIIASGGPEDIRPGSAEECAALTASVEDHN